MHSKLQIHVHFLLHSISYFKKDVENVDGIKDLLHYITVSVSANLRCQLPRKICVCMCVCVQVCVFGTNLRSQAMSLLQHYLIGLHVTSNSLSALKATATVGHRQMHLQSGAARVSERSWVSKVRQQIL